MPLFRRPRRMRWRTGIVEKVEKGPSDATILRMRGGRTYTALPPLLVEPGDSRHDGYVLGLSQLLADASSHGVVRIKASFGRIVGIGPGVPHVWTDELPMLEALGVDTANLSDAILDHHDWDDTDGPSDPIAPGVAVTRTGRLRASISLGPDANYEDGRIVVPRLPHTVATGAVGLPLEQIVDDPRLTPLGLTILDVEEWGDGSALRVLRDPGDVPGRGGLAILSRESAAALAAATHGRS